MVTGAAASRRNAQSPPSPDRPNFLWRFLRGLTRFALPLWFRLRARGIEKIPSHGPALLVINHQSFLDSMLVGTPLARPISFLARDSLFRVPVVGWILKNTYVMPVNRQAASSSSLRLATERLKQGFLVGIFPEGTRSSDGQIGPLKPGFIALIRRVDAPVIPVGIAGERRGFSAWRVVSPPQAVPSRLRRPSSGRPRCQTVREGKRRGPPSRSRATHVRLPAGGASLARAMIGFSGRQFFRSSTDRSWTNRPARA